MSTRMLPLLGLLFLACLNGSHASAASASANRYTADRAAQRKDENSMIAHEQLVAKAKTGRIDLYFLGDSITRRWGCTDPDYAPMLEHWRRHFFGWNAGNFGWGGDSIQHMLWRIQNGELDGVNPKVIVVLAGTNNVGKNPGGDAKVSNIIEGVRVLLATCREKAPDAVIVLTGILPRNDSVAVLPEIARINDGLAEFADDRTIFFININDQLADADGRLFDGMTVDSLHLSVQGYEVWAKNLEPLLVRFLGPRSKEDHAPPPTGDPKARKA